MGRAIGEVDPVHWEKTMVVVVVLSSDSIYILFTAAFLGSY